MLNFIGNIIDRLTGSQKIPETRSDPSSRNDLTPYEMHLIEQSEGCCPDCGSKLLSGPEGGASQNVACSNTACASEFNLMWPLTGHRNGKLSPNRARAIYGMNLPGE